MKVLNIQSFVPLIPKRLGITRPRKNHKYQIKAKTMVQKVRTLELGQSFKILAEDTRELQRRMAGAIGGSYIKGNQIFGRRFSIRQVEDGVRVWRVK